MLRLMVVALRVWTTVPTTGELTFPEGSTDAQSFTVTVLGNNLDQPNRTFIVFLTNPENATVGIPMVLLRSRLWTMM